MFVNSTKVNNSGSWTNGTWQTFTAGNWSNFTVRFPSKAGSNFTIKIYANDISNNQNVTGVWFWWNVTPAVDSTKPTYSKNVTNTTTAGQPILFSLEANDDISLNPNGKYLFSTNNTGTWKNASWVSFTSNPQNMTNVTILNTTVGTKVAWCFYFNDTYGNMNVLSCLNPFILTTTDTIPLTITIQNPSNTTYSNKWVWANVTLNKAGSWCGVSLNETANQTLTNSTGNWNLNLSVPSNGANNVRFYCNDTSKKMNFSVVYFNINTILQTVPAYSNNANNNTLTGQPTLFSLSWTDNIGLSGYVFSTNNSGTWQNASFISFSGVTNVSTNITILNSIVGTVVGWRFYANDTSNKWSVSDVYSLVTTSNPVTTNPVVNQNTGGVSTGACTHSLIIDNIKNVSANQGDNVQAKITIRNVGCYDEGNVSVKLDCPTNWSCESVNITKIKRGENSTVYLNVKIPSRVENNSYVLPVIISYGYQSKGKLILNINTFCKIDSDCEMNETCLNNGCVKLGQSQKIDSNMSVEITNEASISIEILLPEMSNTSPDGTINFTLVLNINQSNLVLLHLKKELIKDNQTVWQKGQEMYVNYSEKLTEDLRYLSPGDYIIKIEATYGDKTTSIVKSFTVKPAVNPSIIESTKNLTVAMIGTAIILIIIIFKLKLRKRDTKN
jgi:hypothetical protein